MATLARAPFEDELLRSIEAPAVAVALCAGADAGQIRARVRLGETDRPDRLAGHHPGQPGSLLGFAAQGLDLPSGEGVHVHHGGEAAVAGGDLLHRQDEGQEAHTRASEGFSGQEAEEAEFAHGVGDVLRDVTGPVPLAAMRRQPFPCEAARHVADLDLVVAEHRADPALAP